MCLQLFCCFFVKDQDVKTEDDSSDFMFSCVICQDFQGQFEELSKHVRNVHHQAPSPENASDCQSEDSDDTSHSQPPSKKPRQT